MKGQIALGALIVALLYVLIFRFELCCGVCLNDNGDGRMYNGEPYYNYISYSSTDAKAGDEVVSVFVLNPLNTYCDDYIYRNDWVIRR